jgi:hypothetical protein
MMTMRFSATRNWIVAAVMAVVLMAPGAALAEEGKRASRDAGLGLATVVANVFYVPVKVGYAVVGGVTGGLAYALSAGNKTAASKVWVASMGGDYVLSPDQVAGRQKVKFAGQTDPDM